MASTAAGVAVGSTVGHGLSSMLFGGGGGSSQAVEAAPAAPVEQQSFQQARMGGACELQAKGEPVLLQPSSDTETLTTQPLVNRLCLVLERHW